MDKVDKFAHWLNAQPNPTEIAKFLVNDCCSAEAATGSRISVLNSDRSLAFIGEYGHEDRLFGQSFKYEIWRDWRIDAIGSELPSNESAWVSEHKTLFAVLVNKMAGCGFVAVSFSDEIADLESSVSKLKSLSYPLSLQLFSNKDMQNDSYRPTEITSDVALKTKFINQETSDITPIEISERQIAILKLLDKDKTNHEIATELGYSVSTIRHDIMGIFRLLKLSSRHEAGDRARAFGLI